MDAGAMLCRPRTRSCSAPDACGDERGRARGASEDLALLLLYNQWTDDSVRNLESTPPGRDSLVVPPPDYSGIFIREIV